MDKRIKLIANPISGGDSRPRIEQARTFLEQNGARVDLYLTGKRGDATAEAARLKGADYDLVLVGGGDGTLNEVANGLVGCGIPLAFLPLGTANVMALEMGIPIHVESACRIALWGEARPVTLVETDGGFFLMMAGLGFDAAAVRAVSPRLKRRIGKAAYLLAGLSAFVRYRPAALQIQTAEGKSLQAWHVIFSNIRLYGGRFVLAPQGGLEKSGLIACLIDRPGRFAILLFWLRILLRGRLLGDVKRVESVSFNLTGPVVPVQIDGDDAGNTPFTVTSCSGLIELVFPSTAQKRA